MARKSRITEYAKNLTKEQASGPALSIREKLSEMKERTKKLSKKTGNVGKDGK